MQILLAVAIAVAVGAIGWAAGVFLTGWVSELLWPPNSGEASMAIAFGAVLIGGPVAGILASVIAGLIALRHRERWGPTAAASALAVLTGIAVVAVRRIVGY